MLCSMFWCVGHLVYVPVCFWGASGRWCLMTPSPSTYVRARWVPQGVLAAKDLAVRARCRSNMMRGNHRTNCTGKSDASHNTQPLRTHERIAGALSF